MERVKGGYVSLILSSATIYTDAINALNSKKPIFIYDGSNISIVDTIVLNDNNTIIINGELTIATDGTLSPSNWKIKATPSLYVHSLSFSVGETNIVNLQLSLITTFSDLITDIDLQRGEDLPNEKPNPKWLLNNFRFIPAFGFYRDNSNYYAINGISSSTSSSFNILYVTNNNSSASVVESYEIDCSDIHTVVDNVRQLI